MPKAIYRSARIFFQTSISRPYQAISTKLSPRRLSPRIILISHHSNSPFCLKIFAGYLPGASSLKTKKNHGDSLRGDSFVEIAFSGGGISILDIGSANSKVVQ